FFPATASLASFSFIMMSMVVSWRFFAAVLVMFASGLVMAAYLLHAFLIFALAWSLVLNSIGVTLLRRFRTYPSAQWEDRDALLQAPPLIPTALSGDARSITGA